MLAFEYDMLDVGGSSETLGTVQELAKEGSGLQDQMRLDRAEE